LIIHLIGHLQKFIKTNKFQELNTYHYILEYLKMNSNNFNAQNSSSSSQFNNSNLQGSNSGLRTGLSSGFAQTSNYGYTSATSPIIQEVLLPTQVIEKPVAIHEEIRNERVEEIQPVVNIEKFKTEVHQLKQPLFDREIKAVQLERGVLPSQYLPEVNLPGMGTSLPKEVSTVHMQGTTSRMVEKPAIYYETDKKQIIEEIQPVIYKETVIPTVIQETKPIYQKIVEGAVYTQEVLPARGLATHYTYPVEQPVIVETRSAPILESLPTPPPAPTPITQTTTTSTVTTKTITSSEKLVPERANVEQVPMKTL